MNTPQDSSYGTSAQGQDPGSPGSAQARGAADLAGRARAEGQEHMRHYRDAAADKVDSLADSVKAAASELRDDDVGDLSRHISDMADGLSNLSDGLRRKSADQILHDVRRVARENPTLFIAGSIALGFGITRFARASATGRADDSGRPSWSGGNRANQTRWSDPDSAVPGTAASPATGNDTIDTTSPDGLTGTIPAVPGPSASTADAISARAGAAASDIGTSGATRPSSTDTLHGRSQP